MIGLGSRQMSYGRLVEALLSGKPYFGNVLRAMQGLAERHKYFYPVVCSVLSSRNGQHPAGGLQILEIGSWAGASTITWALALRRAGVTGQVTCVDPWQPYYNTQKERERNYSEMNAATQGDMIVHLFEHNIRAAGIAEMVQVRRGASCVILPELPTGTFDVISIDGSHSLADVRHDIRQAKRLLRDGGIICGDDLELEASALSGDELRNAVAEGRDYVYSENARAHYHPGVTGAVAEEFSSVGVWNGFWAMRRSGRKWMLPALDLTSIELPEHLRHASSGTRLLESTATHNLVEADGAVFAVSKTLGPVDLFEERLGDRELAPVLLTGDSVGTIRRKLEEQMSCASPDTPPADGGDMYLRDTLLARASKAANPDPPRLSGSYSDFNLVHHAGKVYGVRQSLGEIDLTDGGEALQQRYGPVDFIVGETEGEIRTRVDVFEMFRAIQRGLLEKQQGLEDEMRREFQVLQREMLEKLQSLQAGLLKGQGTLEQIQNQMETLQSDLQEKDRALQTAVLEGQRVLEGVQNEQRALQSDLLQKDKALRAGLLEGQGNVEGVRSEAKALHERMVERQLEFEAKLASLNQEISSTGVRLAEELQQTKTIVHSHSRMWGRLARSWPIRVLFYLSREK